MKTAIDNYVIDKVREMRNKKKLSQKELSYAVNKTKGFVSMRETGPSKYNIAHLNEIAIVLKCSPKDFLPDQPLDLYSIK